MPVRFEIDGSGTHRVRQSFDFPAVYLDHWALRLFSIDPSLGTRFIAALRASGGVLVVSHVNIAELSGPIDQETVQRVAQYLEAALPNVYFALFDYQAVITQENRQRDLQVRLMVPPDIELLRSVGRERPDDVQPFTIANLIKTIGAHRDRVGATFREWNQRLADRINETHRDPAVLHQSRDFRGHPLNLPSLAVFQELMRQLSLDRNQEVTANDAADLMHAVISIAYCDYVLLDGKWEELYARMVRRFGELRYALRVAQVFSRRRGGIERFLAALAGHRP